MKLQGTLLLARSEVKRLLGLEDCMDAVERALELHAKGLAAPPGILGIHAQDGGFHIKAGLLKLGRRPYFAAKTNANFPANAKRFGLPLIQGVIALFDAENGRPLALMDSMEITILRTGAATGVAAKLLARTDAKVATICGCGNQGRISLEALASVRPLNRVYAYDVDESRARRFAAEMSEETGIAIEAVQNLTPAVGDSDICVTATPSKRYFIHPGLVSPGTFIAAVGADNEEKQEIDPALIASSKVVVDSLEQCATIGDLHHALEDGLMARADVHAELGEVIAGLKEGRTSESEVIVFDSTGIALEDVAAAATVYENATSRGIGQVWNLGE
ncbi:MAG TPA: ornithine cyclodeaminase family protein [Vicinamibacteria bacterium]|nr:ornithine cyclodeaminase family protein [Vicinamibacteria bacterium]